LSNAAHGIPPRVRLAIFDIDGTLTATNAVDDHCFVQAVAQTLKLDPRVLDWSSAPHITDSGLLSWSCQVHCHRPIRPDEIDTTLHCFHGLLQEQLALNPAQFAAIPGVPHILQSVHSAGWHVAIATGGWSLTAKLKLAAIGLDSDDFVLVSASDAMTRHEILRLARQKAEAQIGGGFRRLVSIGDGLWDVSTAAALCWPFVGIGSGKHADRLREAGATSILPDLGDLERVLHELDHAQAPFLAPHDALAKIPT
jgi:phosphoglycolate phosphatase-like HAD superfamily hydrolase